MIFLRLITRFTYLLAMTVVWSVSPVTSANQDALPTNVRFCAPEHDIYPFFVQQQDVLGGINMDMLNQIFTAQNLPDTTLIVLRRPWKRCIIDLEIGQVDMMIGGYDAGRLDVSYPDKLGFDLENAVLSTADVCFYSLPGKQMRRTRAGLAGKAPFVVGIEAGFSKQHDSEINPTWVELFNPVEKYRMLEKGRVDAIVQVCAMDGVYPIEPKADLAGFTAFQALFPAYLSNPAYVVFSDAFANQHTALARKIVTLSTRVDKLRVYRRYQPDMTRLPK